MTQVYSDPTRADDPWSLPDVEVFHLTQQDFIRSDVGSLQRIMLDAAMECGSDRMTEAAGLSGWYYWFCFPGCLPESDTLFGPFSTEELAINSAQDGNE